MKNAAERLNENLGKLDQAERARGAGLRLKVSEKGAVSVYGLGRFPVTLYREQWERLLAFAGTGQLAEFIRANASKLKVKDDGQTGETPDERYARTGFRE